LGILFSLGLTTICWELAPKMPREQQRMHSHAWVISSQLPAIFDQQEESHVQMRVCSLSAKFYSVFIL
jgi:hypothetical protein